MIDITGVYGGKVRTFMNCPTDGCRGTIVNHITETRQWAFGLLGYLEPCPMCKRVLAVSLGG